MHIVRYRDRVTRQTGVAVDADGLFGVGTDRTSIGGFADLLRLPLTDLRALVTASIRTPLDRERIELLSPCDGLTEVWGAGVTYQRSRDARIEESSESSVYDRLYDADRPELFFKSVPWRVVTDGEKIAVRHDSALNVPEPELALVVNAHREVVGYTVCNDVSSRSIEGENPLYLPQAKIYRDSCALAQGVRPSWEVPDPAALQIEVEIARGPEIIWRASTSTELMHRRFAQLVDWLFRQMEFPEGVILSTGTGLVPPMDVTLLAGDIVRISIEGVGNLENPVNSHLPLNPVA